MTVSRISCGVGLLRDRQPNWVAGRIIADTGHEAHLMIDEDERRVLEAMDPVFGRMNRIHIEDFVDTRKLGNAREQAANCSCRS